MKKSDYTFEEVTQMLVQHLAERHWSDLPSRGLAISIALEANELLEHYQWQDEPVGGVDEVADELADVMIYAMQLARVNNIDIPKAIAAKLAKSAQKYPAEKFQTTDPAKRRAAWLDAKKNHQKDTIL